jgi:hypothetical protein
LVFLQCKAFSSKFSRGTRALQIDSIFSYFHPNHNWTLRISIGFPALQGSQYQVPKQKPCLGGTRALQIDSIVSYFHRNHNWLDPWEYVTNDDVN